MSRFIEIKGRVQAEFPTDKEFLPDLIQSLQDEYPYCHSNAKFTDGGTCWQVTVIHKKPVPLKETVVANIRGHVQGWMHASTGTNGR